MNSLTITLLWLSFLANGEQLAAPRPSANPDSTFRVVSQGAYWTAAGRSAERGFIKRRLLLEKLFLLNQKKKLKGLLNPTDKVKGLLQIIDAELKVVERELERGAALRLDLANVF